MKKTLKNILRTGALVGLMALPHCEKENIYKTESWVNIDTLSIDCSWNGDSCVAGGDIFPYPNCGDCEDMDNVRIIYFFTERININNCALYDNELDCMSHYCAYSITKTCCEGEYKR